MDKCLRGGYMEDRNTKGTLHAKPWGFRVELVVDFFIDYGGGREYRSIERRMLEAFGCMYANIVL